MMWMGVQNRAAIAQAVFEESLPVAMATLQRASPTAWLNVSKCGLLLYNAVFGVIKDSAEPAAMAGFDVIQPLLESGYLAACVAALETFAAEKGPTGDSNVMSFFFGVCPGPPGAVKRP